MKKLKKQIVGMTAFNFICSLVLGCILGLAITGVICYTTLYVTDNGFELVT